MKFLATSLITALLVFASSITATSIAQAASAQQIEDDVNETLHRFVDQIGGARALANKAVGILVFPSIVKAGFGIGGEYGEASFGFQLGIQERSVIIMFMTQDALDQFYSLQGFKIGVDASVAIITLGVGGSIDSDKITQPVIGFVLDPKGLMYNLTLEGSKITKIDR